MDWIQFSLFVVVMSGIYFSLKSETNSDRRDINLLKLI